MPLEAGLAGGPAFGFVALAVGTEGAGVGVGAGAS
jgi:hypothetical protein